MTPAAPAHHQRRERLFVAARLATAQQQYLRAATLFGLANQMHSQIHYAVGGPMCALADAALAMVCSALDPAVFAETFAAGQQMSLVEAFATILAPGHVGGVHWIVLGHRVCTAGGRLTLKCQVRCFLVYFSRNHACTSI